MPVHHRASFLASAELNIDRLPLLIPSLMMLPNGRLGAASIGCRLLPPLEARLWTTSSAVLEANVVARRCKLECLQGAHGR